LGRYRVTLALQFGAEQEAVVAQLPAVSRCRQEMYAEARSTAIMITATPSTARLLSSDPRVVVQ
jgi:hypothetical protein